MPDEPAQRVGTAPTRRWSTCYSCRGDPPGAACMAGTHFIHLRHSNLTVRGCVDRISHCLYRETVTISVTSVVRRRQNKKPQPVETC